MKKELTAEEIAKATGMPLEIVKIILKMPKDTDMPKWEPPKH